MITWRWLLCVSVTLLVGCSPALRFRPGEIPTPSSPGNASDIHSSQQLRQEIINRGMVLYDGRTESRVGRVIERLLAVTPTTGHWTVTLVDDESVNAMTSPGNFIFVFRGILEKFREDDELAAFLAHEIGHRLAQHEIKSSDEALGEAVALLASIAAGVAVATQQGATQRQVQETFNATSQLGQGFTTLRYSRDKEREADVIGIFLMADAGFDPGAAARVWQIMSISEGDRGSDFLSTHPLHEDRYAMMSELLPLARERQQASRSRPRNAPRQLPPALLSELERGHQAVQKGDLATASSIATSLTRKSAAAPEGYNLLGLVNFKQGNIAKAEKAFRSGLSRDPTNNTLLYNVACSEALQGKNQAALRSLERALSGEPALVETARTDSDLDSLRDMPEFARIIAQEYTPSAPRNVGGNSFDINGRRY